MRNKFKLISILIIFSMFLTGCWDKIEIDRRIFVSTIAIDPGKDIDRWKDLKNVNKEDPFQERQIKKLKVTYGFPDISMLGPNIGGAAEEKNIMTEGYSMTDCLSEAISKSSRSVHLGQSKLLILSDSILSYPDIMKEVMDYFKRNPSINRSMNIVIVEGSAEEYENFKPKMERNFQNYVSGLMENSNKTASILPTTLNEFLKLLGDNGSAIVPYMKIDKNKNELILYGIGLIKDYKFIGNLNSVETSDIEILRGKVKSGKKVIYKDGHPIDYSIEGVERKLKIKKIDKNKLEMDIDIKIEGAINGFTVEKDLLSADKIREIEGDFNKSLGVECEKVINMLQYKYNIEPFGIREHIKKYHPYKWREIEKNWEEIYKGANIKVNFDTKIRRIGITR
ncbi:Ger(x)C family spore germination protein [Hathewaya histolytica]|uniref:Ger(x)C family spore germination protein n=1 Tax=Hathewaya histolytica TaxID=1498 RepID=UPI003B67FEBF